MDIMLRQCLNILYDPLAVSQGAVSLTFRYQIRPIYVFGCCFFVTDSKKLWTVLKREKKSWLTCKTSLGGFCGPTWSPSGHTWRSDQPNMNDLHTAV